MMNLIDPFWLSTTAYAESVVFIGDGSRSIEANLLFCPTQSLRSPTPLQTFGMWQIATTRWTVRLAGFWYG